MKRLVPALVALAIFVVPTTAQVTSVNVGLLSCQVAAGVGLVVGSRKSMTCNYQPGGGGATQYYTGTIEKLGLDIGFTEQESVSWAVFAVEANASNVNLSGTYGGASAQATLGVGIGANALLGGSRNSYSLQPFSGQTQRGLNLAIGIASLQLQKQ
ncbi:MAG: DUF992 domain-containing protein [Hyphomicrobiales bacterium]